MIYLSIFAAIIAGRYLRFAGLTALLLIFLYFFVAFRFEVGCDWRGYIYQYLAADSGPDRLWTLFLDLHKALGAGFIWLNVSSALVFFAGAYAFARRQPDPAAILIFLFPILILNIPMSGIRQAAATGVIFFALNAFRDRRTLHFVVWVLVASAIHSSAAVFLLAAPFINGGLTRTRMFVAALLLVPAFFGLANSGSLEIANTRYLENEVESFGGPFRLGVLFLSSLFYALLLRPYWKASRQRDLYLADIGAAAMAALPLLLPVSTLIADRLGYYFIPIQAMIFARIPYLGIRNNRALMIALPYALLFVVLGTYVLTSSLFETCYQPYRTWLFGLPETRYESLGIRGL